MTRSVLITGAASGIGHATAVRLAPRPRYRVTLTARLLLTLRWLLLGGYCPTVSGTPR